MIQDISPHLFENTFHPDAVLHEKDRLVIYQDRAFLLQIQREERTIDFPKLTDLKEEKRGNLTYLFEIDGTSYDLYFSHAGEKVCEILQEPDIFAFYSLKEIRSWNLEPKVSVFAVFTAFHLAEWYESNRFCGRCGTKTQSDTEERAMYCPCCKRKIYPRINPAVIIGVTNGDKIVLTRYRTGFASNALVAGFTEIGETLEETVKREVMEEVGLKVKNIRYYKSQPWGIAADILMGFYCEVDGDDTIRMDASELKYAEWVKREDIVLQPNEYSLTNEMMKRFQDGEE